MKDVLSRSRNPKHEARNPKQVPSTKFKSSKREVQHLRHAPLGHSSLFRASNFGFRALQPLSLGLCGGLLLWAAFPRINLPWLAWIAPLPWLRLARAPQLRGWRPYVA